VNKDAKIYVAGHRGLVGSAIVRKLRDQGCENLVLKTHGELELTDQAAVNHFFGDEKPEYIFLAAARVGGILANDTYPADFIRDNLSIQTNVIDAAYRFGATKLLFLGSACIYPKLCPQPMKEEYLLTGSLEPTNECYAVAKIAGIKMCQAYRKQYGFNSISVMPINLYGPWDNFDLEKSHVLPALIRKFHLAKIAMNGDAAGIIKDEGRFGPIPEPFRSKLMETASCGQAVSSPSSTPLITGSPARPLADLPVVLWGTGTPRREFLHVDDLADACVFLMQNYDSGDIVNLGVGEDLTIGELAEMVAEAVDFKGSISFDSTKPDGTPQKLLDISHIQSLGWKPRIGLSNGIKRTYEWYREQ
jgi:GDP-L-fucose synthase